MMKETKSNSIFYQRDYRFNSKRFEIKDEGLAVESRSLFKKRVYFQRFEDLGVKRIESTDGKKIWFGFTIFFALTTLLSYSTRSNTTDMSYVVSLFFAAVSGVVFFFTYKNCVFLAQGDNSQSIEFLNNKPDEQSFNDFIAHLIRVRNAFLVLKYGTLNPNLSYEQQYAYLSWLNRVGALPIDDFDQKLRDLDDLFAVGSLNGFCLN